MAKKKSTATSSPELQQYEEAQRQSVNAYLARFALLLQADGVVQVRVEYSGYGDSGQIDGIKYFRRGEPAPEEIDTATDGNPFGGGAMSKSFEEFLYALMDARGWEVNNEGSQGYIVWDLKEDTLFHHHETNYTATEDTNHDGVLDLIGRIDPDGENS